MRIAIDARTYFLRSGVGRYTRGIVDSLVRLFEDDQYVLFLSNHKKPSDFPYSKENLELLISAADLNDRDKETSILFQEMSGINADLVFFPFFIMPGRFDMPSVTTILDLTFVRFPQYHDERNIRYLNSYLRSSLLDSTAVIAISNYVRNDVLAYAKDNGLNLKAEKVVTIYPGVDESFMVQIPREVQNAVLDEYGLSEKGYLLFVGSIEPRKNLPGLLKAYASCGRLCIPLVICGLKRWGEDNPEEMLSDLGLHGKVKMPGFVPDEHLPVLYRNALAVVYPSFAEGFGFPVAESYAAGTPVITSNNSTLREIGTAALLVDPHDTDAITAAIRRIVDDADLRAKLSDAGHSEAVKYRWASCAREVRRLFTSLAGDS